MHLRAKLPNFAKLPNRAKLYLSPHLYMSFQLCFQLYSREVHIYITIYLVILRTCIYVLKCLL